MNIEVRGLTKQIAGNEILKGIDMDIPMGGFLSLLGPSGAGKTTLLRILAGILDQDRGTILYPPCVTQSPVMVFQDYQLFPYMSVFNNIAFGLQARRKPRKEIKDQVTKIAGKLDIQNRLDAFPEQLSGGEKQRCALARALILNPQVIMLDEPFANLDKNLKNETARLLRNIQQDFNLTMISVSHDQEEAMMLSDTVALLINGELMETGRAEQIYFHPRTLEGARFLGRMNSITAEYREYFQLTEKSQVYCRPEDLVIEADPEGKALVVNRIFMGRIFNYLIKLGDNTLEVYSSEKDFYPGDRVSLKLKAFFDFTGKTSHCGINQTRESIK